MSRGFIAFIIVAGVGLGAMLLFGLKKAADDTKKRSDNILEEFKSVDNSLRESIKMTDTLNQQLKDSFVNSRQKFIH